MRQPWDLILRENKKLNWRNIFQSCHNLFVVPYMSVLTAIGAWLDIFLGGNWSNDTGIMIWSICVKWKHAIFIWTKSSVKAELLSMPAECEQWSALAQSWAQLGSVANVMVTSQSGVISRHANTIHKIVLDKSGRKYFGQISNFKKIFWTNLLEKGEEKCHKIF